MKSKRKIPTEGWVMILILFGYAQNEWIYPWFSGADRVHHFLDGHTSFNLSWQNVIKGFTDTFLQFIKAIAICLLMRKYAAKIAWFFYVMAGYSVFNLFLYWWNYSQWHWPFQIMWVGMLVAAVRLWPRVFKLRRV